MKKIGILNSEISRVISGLGHTDQIVVCDAGFPIPSHVERIDLSLIPGVPSFLATLETVLIELKVERVYYAEEIARRIRPFNSRSTRPLLTSSARRCRTMNSRGCRTRPRR